MHTMPQSSDWRVEGSKPWLLNMRKGLDHIRKKTITEVKAAQEAVSALEADHWETGGPVSPQ